MRIQKKEIETVAVSFRLEGEHGRGLGRLSFRYSPKDKMTYMDNMEYSGLSVNDGVKMLKLMQTLAPNLEKAIEDAVKDVKNF